MVILALTTSSNNCVGLGSRRGGQRPARLKWLPPPSPQNSLRGKSSGSSLLSSVPGYLYCRLNLLTSLSSVSVYICCYLYLASSAVLCICLPLLSFVPVYLCSRLFLSNSDAVCTCLPLLSCVLCICLATASVSCSPPSS